MAAPVSAAAGHRASTYGTSPLLAARGSVPGPARRRGLQRRDVFALVVIAGVGAAAIALLFLDARAREASSVRELFENTAKDRARALEKDVQEIVNGGWSAGCGRGAVRGWAGGGVCGEHGAVEHVCGGLRGFALRVRSVPRADSKAKGLTAAARDGGVAHAPQPC